MNTKENVLTYQKGLNELRGNLSKMLPEEALGVFDTDAENLQKTHTTILKANVGDKATDFSLSNALDETVSLSKLLQHHKVVLVFLPWNLVSVLQSSTVPLPKCIGTNTFSRCKTSGHIATDTR